jgi:tRNA U34 5-methylaminomethyl-2-thiouridine-forming methyltransferase MnmC
LRNFPYPEEFGRFLPVVDALSKNGRYEDEDIFIDVHIGDAREYLHTCTEQFDIVYHDAFSPDTNPALWTKEYFADIARLMKNDAVLTTYSIALKTRLALYENGMNVYLNKMEGCRDSTLASKSELPSLVKVDMEHKISCNPGARPLYDKVAVR